MSYSQYKLLGLGVLVSSLLFAVGCETGPPVQSGSAHAGQVQPANSSATTTSVEAENTIRILTDRVESLEFELERAQKRMIQLYDDIDIRLRKLERNSSAIEGTSKSTKESDTESETSSTIEQSSNQTETPEETDTQEQSLQDGSIIKIQVEVEGQDDREIYDNGFRALRDGEYEDAIAEFSALIQQFPNSPLVDDAWYWIAEANYVMQKFESALPDFERIVREFPNSQRASDSMLKIGYIFYDLADYERAQKYLIEVIEKYPASRSAFSARRRLDEMKRKGYTSVQEQ